MFKLIFMMFNSLLFGFYSTGHDIKKDIKQLNGTIVIAVLLSFILFFNGLALNEILYNYLISININNPLYADLIVLFIYLILGAFVYLSKFTLFPEEIKGYFYLEKNQKKEFRNYILLITFVSFLLLLWTLYIKDNLKTYPTNSQYAIFSFSIFVFTIFTVFIKVFSIYAVTKVEILIDRQYQSELVNFMHIIRSQRHDFNFHLQAISGMLDDKKYSECSDYVKTMVMETSVMNEILPLYHPAIGALLHTFREISAQKGIKLEIQIFYNLDNTPCTVYEMNKVIGNLVQNAIDEIESNRNNEPWVKIMILKRGGNCLIKVSNKISRDISDYKNIFKAGYSTKQAHEGIGLTTVQKIVSKYGGSIYLEFEGDTIHFIAQIPIRY